jgi:anthranilate phosphoribosyltransferase
MATITTYTDQVTRGQHLTPSDVADAVTLLLAEDVTDDAKADLLAALARKGETAGEIAAFALELRSRAVNPQIDPARHGGILLDVCGTGADMAHTFNISSCVMFIAAAAGIAVVKHGNRAITSQSGSADVLLALGAKIDMTPDAARACLERCGITFLFAPNFHPAFKKIAPVRKKLGERKQRTVFNILGPLVNPARPTHQLVGIFDKSLVSRYAQVLGLVGVKRALVANGNGLDELTTLGENTAVELRDGNVAPLTIPLTDLPLQPATSADLAGGNPAANAQIIRDLLAGTDRGPRRDIVQLNAAAALYITGKANSIVNGWKLASDLIDSGKAAQKLDAFAASSQET